MRSTEISAAELGDLSEIGDGRLVVHVRGRDARLVPNRSDWTDTTRQALALTHQWADRCARFVIPRDSNAGARAANRIRIGDMASSLRRARATLLTAPPRSRDPPTGAPRRRRAARNRNPGRPARRDQCNYVLAGGHRSAGGVRR